MFLLEKHNQISVKLNVFVLKDFASLKYYLNDCFKKLKPLKHFSQSLLDYMTLQ